ncbi:hypothetical protein MP228_001757 [Amoeboaphelidium protococcarum]|nr:hypothetical protein MP228_001757 [Amoeboaphelidium protococcarum]
MTFGSLQIGESQYKYSLSSVIDVSRRISSASETTAFGLGALKIQKLCSVSDGASVNCSSVQLIPHAHSTHTECVGHINGDGTNISDLIAQVPPLMLCQVVSLESVQIDNDDQVVNLTDTTLQPGVQALMVNVIGQSKSMDYCGSNPPYLDAESITSLRLQCPSLKHLLTNLPSVDREDDGGKLQAHKALFDQNPYGTITELCYIPDAIQQENVLQSDCFRLTNLGGALISCNDNLRNYETICVRLNVLGGKGGFKNQLRSMANKMDRRKTDNNEECRDLSGTKLKVERQAEKLADFQLKSVQNSSGSSKSRNEDRMKKLEKKISQKTRAIPDAQPVEIGDELFESKDFVVQNTRRMVVKSLLLRKNDTKSPNNNDDDSTK